MKMKDVFTLCAAAVLVPSTRVPLNAQEGECVPCRCCNQWCTIKGSDIGPTGPEGYWPKACGTTCGYVCGNPGEENAPTVSAADLQTLWELSDSADEKTIKGLLDRYPSGLEVNRDRKAIQILGCGEQPIGHLRIPDRVLAAVLPEGQPN